MSIKNTITTYGSLAKFFHWLIFLLLFCMITFGFFLDDVPKDLKPVTYNIHKLTGLTILALMTMRLLWALTNIKPRLAYDTPLWQVYAAKIVHFSLYLTVIAMPIAGWIGSLAAGRPPHIGDIKLAFPLEQNKALSEGAFEVHEFLAFAIIVLFCIHVSAALYHHYVKKDDVLKRMMPS